MKRNIIRFGLIPLLSGAVICSIILLTGVKTSVPLIMLIIAVNFEIQYLYYKIAIDKP